MGDHQVGNLAEWEVAVEDVVANGGRIHFVADIPGRLTYRGKPADNQTPAAAPIIITAEPGVWVTGPDSEASDE